MVTVGLINWNVNSDAVLVNLEKRKIVEVLLIESIVKAPGKMDKSNAILM